MPGRIDVVPGLREIAGGVHVEKESLGGTHALDIGRRHAVAAKVGDQVAAALVLRGDLDADAFGRFLSDQEDLSPKAWPRLVRIVADLPRTLVGQERREVEDRERGAAWGDPPVVLVCGAEVPESFDDFSAVTIRKIRRLLSSSP